MLFLPSFSVFAHEVSKEEIAQLKGTAERLREQLRQAEDRRNLFCNQSVSKSDNILEQTKAMSVWKKACDQSQDPEIVQARDKFNNASLAFEQFKWLSPEYKALNSSTFLAILPSEDRAEMMQPIQEKWLITSRPVYAKKLEAHIALYNTCKESKDPQVAKAYRYYQDSRTNCSKAREFEITTHEKFTTALQDYNQAVHQSKESHAKQTPIQRSSSKGTR